MINSTSEPTNSAPEAVDLASTSTNNSEPIKSEKSNSESQSASNSNGVSAVNTQSVATPITEPTTPSAEAVNPMAQNTINTAGTTSTTTANPATSNVSAIYGNYDDYQLLPEAPWPPPIFVRRDISPQERYYIEHRWYSQWSFFDSKATQNKKRYYLTQLIVGLGSVTVPVLVGINPVGELAGSLLYLVTVVVSLAVAMSTAIESLYTFGDNWRSYRSAAEDLHQEKSLYDVKAGRYANNTQSFLRFVERCEEIIAQQNGRWIQSQEKAAEQAKELGDEFLDSTGVDAFGNKVSSVDKTRTTTVEETYSQDFATPTTPASVDSSVADPATPSSYG